MRRALSLIGIVALALLVAACDSTTEPRALTHGALTDPVGAAATLPPSVHLTLPVDSLLTGDTLDASAMAFDFSGKAQNQGKIQWAAHAVDSAPGTVSITPWNTKAQQVTIKGLTRGRLEIVVTYVDRYGQVARDSAGFHVAPRTAGIGICLLDPRIADSLGIHGDTTVSWWIVGPFCIQNDTLVINHPTPTPGMDTTKAPPDLIGVGARLATRIFGYDLLLDAKFQVQVHIRRPKGVTPR